MSSLRRARLKISSPGRICLFGEHQDYLRLPVLAAAISLRVTIEGVAASRRLATIHLPDVGLTASFPLDHIAPYVHGRDYLRAGFNVLLRRGFVFSSGFECQIRGSIPIGAGTSSSSALVVAWVNFLSQMSDERRSLSAEDSTLLAFEAEVTEFGEPGGMMDHCSSSYGGVLHLNFVPALQVERLTRMKGNFVLGDSGESKGTRDVLSRVRSSVERVLSQISRIDPELSLHSIATCDVERYRGNMSADDFNLLGATLRNREITREARELFMSEKFDERLFGALLNEEQSLLRDVLHVSTPKIDAMIDAALGAGACGGKINGSGGGGCMFVYAPDDPQKIAEVIERAGGKSYVIGVDEGVRIEQE